MVKKRSILVVDDEENVAETIKMVLEQEGYRATTAYTAEAAITPLRHTKFSAVITDLNMEKQDIGLVNPKAYRFIAMAEADHRLGLNVRLLFRYGTCRFVEESSMSLRDKPVILSISYDAELLTLREAFLKTQGYEVRSVMSIEEALLLASVQHFDALIVGHSVPLEDKKKLVTAVKDLWPRLPVLSVAVDPGVRETVADASVLGSAGPDALMGALDRLILENPVRGRIVSGQNQQ
jgi:DNA-binding NtrC family response regulator